MMVAMWIQSAFGLCAFDYINFTVQYKINSLSGSYASTESGESQSDSLTNIWPTFCNYLSLLTEIPSLTA